MTPRAAIVYSGEMPWEETPEVQYTSTDKSQVLEWSASFTRLIHCWEKDAERIKQNATFGGDVVKINGKNYGAGWEVTGVSTAKDGVGGATVSISYTREGVTCFEFGLPEGLWVDVKNGVATLYYHTAAGRDITLNTWNSGAGEDRFGFSVAYEPITTLRYGTSTMPIGSYTVFAAVVRLEQKELFRVDGYAALIKMSSRRLAVQEAASSILYTAWSSGDIPEKEVLASAHEQAKAAGEAALPGWVAALEASASETNVNFMYGLQLVSGNVAIESGTAEVKTLDAPLSFLGGDGQSIIRRAATYTLSVQVQRLEAAGAAYELAHNRGMRWVAEWRDVAAEDGSTARHLFYALRYLGADIMAYDITQLEAMP